MYHKLVLGDSWRSRCEKSMAIIIFFLRIEEPMENITTRRKKNTVITFLKILSFCGFVCLFCICIKRSRIRYIKGNWPVVWYRYKDSEVPGSLVSKAGLKASIYFALTMGNLPSKLCLRYRVGIICHSQEPMTLAVKTFLPCLPCTLAPNVNLQTYPLLRFLGGAFAAFAHIFISLELGPLVGKNGQKTSPSEAHGSESRKYSKGVGER